ncbi:hypothetical protein HZS_1087 [Henneguya salminicola]|nr:hypothetical protein HZS_1087 [Henneguya salminicola]
MDKPLRGTAKGACKIGGIETRAIAQVVASFLKPGEMIYLCPVHITAEAKTIVMHHENLDGAEPSDNVRINLKNIPVADLRKPNIFGHLGNNPPRPVANMTCQVLMIREIGKKNARSQTGKKIEATEENATQFTVKCKETALILVTPNAPLCAEAYSDHKGLGRFALRDQKSSIGVGFVKEIVRPNADAKSGLMAAKENQFQKQHPPNQRSDDI